MADIDKTEEKDENLAIAATKKAKGFAHEFKEFAVKGNVMDLAIGVIIGTAFNNIVQSLVKDIILPPIGFLTGKVDFTNLYVNLSGQSFQSLDDAQKAGAAVLTYGVFLNSLINFLIIALVIFIVVRQLSKMRGKQEKKEDDTTRDCPYCFSRISKRASKCPECTADIKPLKVSKAPTSETEKEAIEKNNG